MYATSTTSLTLSLYTPLNTATPTVIYGDSASPAGQQKSFTKAPPAVHKNDIHGGTFHTGRKNNIHGGAFRAGRENVIHGGRPPLTRRILFSAAVLPLLAGHMVFTSVASPPLASLISFMEAPPSPLRFRFRFRFHHHRRHRNHHSHIHYCTTTTAAAGS